MKRLLAAMSGVSVAALLALAPVGVAAEEPPGEKPQEMPREKPPERRAGKRVLRLDAITVEGKFQKPEAFYILQRANLEFEELEKAESFLPKIVKSQENELF